MHLIQNYYKRFKIFVPIRLSLIHHHTKVEEWHYCPTNLSVTDDSSRPLFPSDIERRNSWFKDPEFLRAVESAWATAACYDRPQSDVALSSYLFKVKNIAFSTSLQDILVLKICLAQLFTCLS